MTIHATTPMDKATFFRWLERQEQRHELVDGVPRMLPHVTSNHARIAMNVIGILVQSLDRDIYDITPGDYAIETGERSVRFADVMVYPFEPRPDARSTVVAPLLVEVLSDSTAPTDFGAKRVEYGRLAGVAQYVIIARDKACAWSWLRLEDGTWPEEATIVEDLTGAVAVPGLGLTISMEEIYRRVPIG